MKTIIVDMSNFMRMGYSVGRGLRDMALDLKAKADQCERLIMVFDGYKSNQYRRDIFAGYKVKTGQSDLNEFYELQKFFKAQYMPLIKGISIEIPYYEADDIIAALARSTSKPTEIHSTDQDYLILTSNPMVRCISKFEPKMTFPVEQMQLYKSLVGDPADKIPGVRGFGPSSFDKLSDAEKQGVSKALAERQKQPFELVSIKGKLLETFNLSWPDVQAFWDVVAFRDVEGSLIYKHTKVVVSSDVAAIMAVDMIDTGERNAL